MRVHHIASEYPPLQVFGLGRAVHDLAVAQAGLGHEVHVVTNSIGGRDPDAVVDGVHVHRISFPPPPKPPDDTMAVTQFNISALETASRAIASSGAPDVVHVHDWLTVLSGRMLKWLHPDASLVCTIHDTAEGKHFGQLAPPQKYSAHLERWIGAEADRIICCSQYVREEMVGHYETPPERITVIPCGVEERQFQVEGDISSFRTLFADPSERMIGYVGRLDREKGLPTLVGAFAKLSVAAPEAKLVLVGKGVLQQAIQQQAREAGVMDRVHFAGYLSGNALAGFYRCCDVLAIPSLYEPFGIVALEGMNNRVPVVASDTGGLGEIMEHERNGVIFPAGDEAALAKALLRVLTDEGLAAGIAQRGYEVAKERYDWRIIAGETIASYGGDGRAEDAAGGE